MDGKRRLVTPELPPAASPEERAGLMEPPAGLHPMEAAAWRAWAPRAIAERTLVSSTEPGFRVLCTRMATVQTLEARVQLLGIGTQDSLPCMKELRGWSALLAISLKDFKLSAFGKPATSDKPKPAANPWGAISSGSAT